MFTILYLWTVVAVGGGDRTQDRVHRDWRNMGEYATYPDCIQATVRLKISAERFLCQPTGRASPGKELPKQDVKTPR